ncbi:MAG: class I SAM-dependent methyltransferase [bacterium]
MKELKIEANAAKNTHKVVADFLREEKNCSTVLDIPCGSGAFSGMMSGSGITVYSADCENLFEIRDGHFDTVDMTKPFPYSDGQFDAVVSIDGIEHIENPFNFIRECARVLRRGGVCVISTPNISSFRSRARWLWTGFHNKNKTPLDETAPNPLHHINMISFPELRYILYANGFRISKIAANRIKTISWLYGLMIPFSYIITQVVFYREEKQAAQRERNRRILKQLFSLPVMFGETMIIKAVRK